MKVNVAPKKTKDIFYTLMPLNWLLRVFNLSSIYLKDNQLIVAWSLTTTSIYIFVFGLVNLFLLLNKIERLDMFRNNSTVTFNDTIQMSYLIGYFEYTVSLFYAYKYGRDCLLKYFKCFDKIDQMLGMTSYDEVRKIILRTVGFCVVIFIVSTVIDYFTWVEGFGWLSPTLYSMDYLYFFLNTLMVLDGMSHVVQLEFRLKLMKDLLEGYYNSSDCMKPVSGDDRTWAIRTVIESNRLESLDTLNLCKFIEIIEFNRCYILLLEQTSYINAKFGLRVIIFCVNLLINMTNLLNVAIRYATGSMITIKGVSYLPTISSVMRFLNWWAVCVIMVYRCEHTYRQSEKILEVIDLLLINKNISGNLKTTLVELRNLLLTRPIKFHGNHFFNIEYTLLVSVMSAVVTYSIILLQSMN